MLFRLKFTYVQKQHQTSASNSRTTFLDHFLQVLLESVWNNENFLPAFGMGKRFMRFSHCFLRQNFPLKIPQKDMFWWHISCCMYKSSNRSWFIQFYCFSSFILQRVKIFQKQFSNWYQWRKLTHEDDCSLFSWLSYFYAPAFPMVPSCLL